ncbi:TPA: plasmid replication protein [Streptococcus suis]|nr:plasmid replication protein [Streptococcus suis]MDW8576294.1 Rep family protein [Streptococcus suis]MDW8590165.1 Rep family protein [Streptococcus suis]MDW8616171.1 Rep family protein [Streptococcus suis]HEL1982184.1 plasmid replication protein [Streptococcus suis]
MGKRIINKRFLFEQQLKSKFWDWSIQDKQLFDNWETNKGKIFRLIFDRVRTLVEEDEFVEFAIVIHDKDISYGTKLVEPHIHGYIDYPKRIDLSKVASALGVERERIETPKSKGGRAYTRINALAYLIHAKDKDKFQYSISDVETFDTLDYETFINLYKEDFENYSATRKREKAEERLDLVLSKVQSGELTYLDVMKDDKLAFLFANNQQKFRESFNFYGEREAFLRLQALQRGDYQLTVLYIQGKPGIGKSTLARDLALETQKRLNAQGLKGEIYSAGSKNPFDNYYGEEILLLDDLRKDSISGTDWLKLFDPINSARMSARYQNKLVVPRLVILSAYMSPKTFFGQIETEDLNQYLRRINFSSEISLKYGMDDRYYSVAQVKEHKEVGYYQRSDGSSIVLNFDFEDLFSMQDKSQFITKLLDDYIYPRIAPCEVGKNV